MNSLLRLKDVRRHVESGKAISDDLPARLTLDDVQAMRNAAAQFQQAANELLILVGFVDGKANG